MNTDEIVVAEGIYFEAINFFSKAITVRSTDPDDPDVVAATVIDGTGSFHVVQCVSGEGLDTVLDGFTITGGNAQTGTGGGMSNIGSSPTVTRCTFSRNLAFGGWRVRVRRRNGEPCRKQPDRGRLYLRVELGE